MKEKNKILIKKTLISSTIFLSIIWLSIFIYGLFIERPIFINIEKSLGQTQIIDVTKPLDKSVIDEVKKKQELDKEIKSITEEPKKQLTESVPQEANLPAQETSPEPIHTELKDKPKPKIAIVVTNLGTNKIITETALKLPKNVTLGFSYSTTTLKPLFYQATKAGYDVLIYLPLQPKDYPTNEPGPYPIAINSKPKKNLNITNSIINTFPGIKGLYGNYKEGFSDHKELFEPILENIAKKQLIFYTGKNIDQNQDYLSSNKVVLGTDIVIDLVPNPESMSHNLSTLVSLARTRGYAIGYLNTYPVSLTYIENWIKELSSDIEIVPISQIKN